MNVRKEIAALFTPDELEYVVEEATLTFTDENDEIDYLLWIREGGRRAEIRLDYGPDLKIWRLDDNPQSESCTKEEFLQMLRSSKPGKLEYIEVE